jgi:hypothetical protein
LYRDKRRLLLAMMGELAGGARISFEGDLSKLALLRISDASQEETAALKRNTIWPKQDFVVVPLEPSTVTTIVAAMGGTIPNAIIHVQIEKGGVLQLGAYDDFHPETIFFGEILKPLLDSLVSQNILRQYTNRPPRPKLKT